MKELIENGVNTEKAMIEAGYSKSYARVGGRKAIHEMIDSAKATYTKQYLKTCQTVGLNGAKAATKLNEAIEKGTYFDAIAAIKEHHRIMFRNQDNVSNITLNGVFMIPTQSKAEDWNAKSKQFKKVIDVKDDSK